MRWPHGRVKVRSQALAGVVGLALAALVAACGGQSRPDALKAPIQVARVSWGGIGYRVVGHGRPLVLLVGAPLTIDNWPPELIDRLALGARVYAIDYEGIGRTTLRRRGFTIPQLADDTADFIRALHLGPADVMGWSFGGFVAQALAIRHPTLVRRLVLAATALGDGTAQFDFSPTAPGDYSCSDKSFGLFSPDASGCAAIIAYEQAIHAYPGFAKERIAVGAKLGNASEAWLAGGVPEGHMTAEITAHVLIGDGKQDAVLLMPDTANLAKAIPHATLKLYSDAGHGFLFQHAADWSRVVLQFLGSA